MFVYGDFSETKDYFKKLVDNTKIVAKCDFNGPGVGNRHYNVNVNYSLTTNNCVTTSIDGLLKGTLSSGTEYSKSIPDRTIFPKVYRNTVEKAFGNTSFVAP